MDTRSQPEWSRNTDGKTADQNVAEDRLTMQSMLGSLSRLRGKWLEAEDFDKLMIGDTPRDLLLADQREQPG